MDLYSFDRVIERAQNAPVVGVDEAGRGPLAGPVVAAAVILNLSRPIEGIMDSKKLSPKKRETLYEAITAGARAWGVAHASVEEIDRYNILRASLMAMQRALDRLKTAWSLALVDGNRPIVSLALQRQRSFVGGDAKSASIAAASIIAKVTRDRLMAQYHTLFPEYDFLKHKGYPTRAHRERIIRYGISPIHRRSFCGSLAAQTRLSLQPSGQGSAS